MKTLFSIGCFVYLLNKVWGLDCHQCAGLEANDRTCNDPYDPNGKVQSGYLDGCDDDQYCVKYKTVVKIRDSGYINGWERHSQVVTRSCESKEGKQEGCKGWTNNGGVTIKCWCGTDGCNAATFSHPVLGIVGYLLLASSVLALLAHWC